MAAFLANPYVQLFAFWFFLILIGAVWSLVAADNHRKEKMRKEQLIKDLTSGVYSIEYVDGSAVRLTRKE